MPESQLTVALITDVFHDDVDGSRLTERLRAARRERAELAVLPELPLDPWTPASSEPSESEAEGRDGPRRRRMRAAAREAGVALLGGAIVRDPVTTARHSTALLFDETGRTVAEYRKLHLPAERGFWESSHYEPGNEPPAVIPALGFPLGIQVCSDVQRPTGSLQLGAMGAEAILSPRATPAESYPRWRLVMRAIAVTASLYVVSVNRTDADAVVPIGGPSVAIGPDGEVLLETTEPVACVTLEREAVRTARREYPGYLAVRSELYARGWARLGGS